MPWEAIGAAVAIVSVVLATSMSAWSNFMQWKAQRQQALDIRTNAIQVIILELSATGRRLQESAQNKDEVLAKFDLAHGLHLIDTGIEAIKTDLKVANDSFHTAAVRRFRDVAIGFIKGSRISDQILEDSMPRVYQFKKGTTQGP